ncbi:toxin Cry1Ac domain D-VI-related protein [Breznakia pachnodae]|uniref:Cell division FtsZ-interacting protein ZapD n=1 Tax=Breznakia pachnodae TaxID=265178 RepID=A0ABU0E0Q5_9FIRM|nr:toxin Cry1Ac domain D-VI-related protein [Breznakia pachnodae]MDQ0360308.1 cell division FtsZ-interacting protein ZapD [Breznakia pachnodae]
MKRINKILASLLAAGVMFSLVTTNIIKANEEVQSTNETITTRTVDAAFPESSKPLHDAILAKYPTVDGLDGTTPDGIISKAEARLWTASTAALTFTDEGIGGTIYGIEYFVQAKYLNFNGNNFTGEIPANIGNMTQLSTLYLANNKLTGTIPESLYTLGNINYIYLGNNQLTGTLSTNIGNLKTMTRFYAQDNQLSGTLPESIGNLDNLVRLHLGGNNFSGSIPSSIGSLPNLANLYLRENQLSGDIPQSIYDNENLTLLDVSDNSGITGNPAEGFANHGKLQQLMIDGTDMIQAAPDISTLTRFDNTDLSTGLLNNDQSGPVDGLTQEQIKKAQDSADWISDPTEKQQWQDNIDKAQNMLNAQTNVVDLLNDTKTDVKDTTTSTMIDDAQALVTTLPDGQFKNDLQAELDLAKEYLNNRTVAQKAVNELFTDSKHSDIKTATDQTTINAALTVVNSLPESTFKEILKAEISKAQNLLDAKTTVDNLFTDNTHTDIKGTTNQAALDNAKAVVGKLEDGTVKTQLQKEIDKAQNILNAKTSVSDLFTDSTHTNIKDTTNQKSIDAAQAAVNKLEDGTVKTQLQKEIDKAQAMLNAKTAVGDLLDDDGKLNTDVTQKEIDKAQDLVNKLPDGDLKDELQVQINDAQKQLDESKKDAEKPVILKPSISGESTGSAQVGNSVNTSDTTNLWIYMSMIIASFGVIGFAIKNKKLNKK